MEKECKEEFRQDAKTIVDLLFNTKILKQDVTRDEMNSFEDYIEFCMASRYKTYVKLNELLVKHKSKHES